jgi:5-methyltetrahydrofolate--homocysteine methyltransferase
MPRAVESPADFTIIAENIHATRVLLRKGRRVTTLEDGTEVVPFTGESGEQLYLRVPESFKGTQPYQQGQIKHFMIAAMKGIGDDPDEREEGAAYVHYEVRRQTAAGASFLDLNVDEVSPNIEIEKEAMAWLMNTVQEVSTLPPSVDSSDAQIIATGLDQYQGGQGRPMINSLALDRMEALDLVREHNARVIVSAAGESGMPSDAEERVANVERVLDAVRAVDISLDDVFVDCLVFPISVSPDYGPSYLDAVTEVRRRYGSDLHITGGLSNVSFGLPRRKLINDTFIYLALEAGIDSGIVNPLESRIPDIFALNTEAEGIRLAGEMLQGRDEYCVTFLQAYRQNRLTTKQPSAG